MSNAVASYKNQTFGVGDFALNGLHLAIRSGSLAMSYETRINRARAVANRLLNLSSDQKKRVSQNLELINLNISGEGVHSLNADQGAILVSGHFGQWESVRLAWRHLIERDCAFFFRPNNNGFYDRHWQSYLRKAGEPIIAKGSEGRVLMERHLAAKGALLMVIDQRMQKADRFDFLGHPAKTATTAAELALHHDMPLIPAYGIRRDNLVDYDVVFEAPIKPSNPKEMTEALNASLGERIRANPEQYLWTHWRWK